MKKRIEIIKYWIFFLLILNINGGMIISSYYMAAFLGKGMPLLFPVLFKYLLIISSGLIIYPFFILLLNLYRTRISNFKKVLFGSAVFLTPNLVFSSSIIRNQINEKIKLFDGREGIFLLLCAAALVYTVIFIISGKKGSGKIKKTPPLVMLLVSSFVLFIFILLDYSGNYFPGVLNNSFNFVSLTVAGYFFICVSSLVFFLFYYTKNRAVCSRLDPASDFLGSRGITNREKEIIRLVMDGCSNKQISDKLYISLSTVKTHLYSIFRKMDVRSRVQLTVLIQKISGKDFPE